MQTIVHERRVGGASGVSEINFSRVEHQTSWWPSWRADRGEHLEGKCIFSRERRAVVVIATLDGPSGWPPERKCTTSWKWTNGRRHFEQTGIANPGSSDTPNPSGIYSFSTVPSSSLGGLGLMVQLTSLEKGSLAFRPQIFFFLEQHGRSGRPREPAIFSRCGSHQAFKPAP